MALLKVARLGHPVLRQIAAPVPPGEIKSETVQKLIDDMIDTMREYEGVGLAAPQVHESRQIAVIEVTNNKRYPAAPPIPLMVIINPIVTFHSPDLIKEWEGCLSIPELRGRVPRSEKVVVRALDRSGRETTIDTGGFLAIVLQHEIDHLNGRVFLDRMTDLSTLTHLKEFERYWQREEREE